MSTWTFLTNHAHVLLCVWEDSEARVRDIATRVGITERAVQRILQELESEQYLVRERVGRRNRYRVKADRPFRHPVEDHRPVALLLESLTKRKTGRSTGRSAGRSPARSPARRSTRTRATRSQAR